MHLISSLLETADPLTSEISSSRLVKRVEYFIIASLYSFDLNNWSASDLKLCIPCMLNGDFKYRLTLRLRPQTCGDSSLEMGGWICRDSKLDINDGILIRDDDKDVDETNSAKLLSFLY